MTRTMLPRRIALLAAIALLPFAAACGKDDSPGPENIAGTYVMRTVDGKPLPALLGEYQDEGVTYRYEVLGGSIVLEQGGGYRETATFRETIDGVPQDPEEAPETGTWTRDGNTVTLRTSDGYATVATYGTGALTVNQGPFLVKYTR